MVTIYHNPRCSKSRQALALLEKQGVEITVIPYLQQPPSAKEIAILSVQLQLDPLAFIRTQEPIFSKLGLTKKDTRNNAQWCQIMADNPILIERPIVVKGEMACIGRPPENVLQLLGNT